MAAVNEDEIVRRRLLFDGNGTGDDKRITSILKSIIQWSVMNSDDEERNLMYQKILALLHYSEYSFCKHHLAYQMNTKERSDYEQLYEHVEQQIVDTKQEIVLCKEELKEAKVIRKNKQEYDALAKIIDKNPGRKAITSETTVLEEDIRNLKKTKSTLLQKLEMRQKQFHVLIYSVQLLQQILNDDAPVEEEKKQEIVIMDLT